MRAWTIVIALGAIGVAAGAFLYVSHSHRTIGLGVIGLGVLLVIVGVVATVMARGKTPTEVKQPAGPPAQSSSYRKALIGVIVIAIIGAGTFYGVSYVSNIAPSGNTVSSSSLQSSSVSTNSLTSSLSQSVSTASGSSTSSGQQTTGTTSGGSTGSSHSSTSGSYQFLLDGQANVTASAGLNATLTAAYTNEGSSSASVNVYITTSYSNGTVISEGLLYSVNRAVPAGGNLSISVPLGPLPSPGAYTVSVYVSSGTYGSPTYSKVSAETTISFTAES